MIKKTIGFKYLTRFHLLPKNPFFNIYLHKFSGNDEMAPHCHPWASLSLLLRGRLKEYYISNDYQQISDAEKHRLRHQAMRVITPGDVIFRRARFTHRLEVFDGPAWSLFITFRRCRNWGFYTKRGFVDSRDALDNNGQLKNEYK